VLLGLLEHPSELFEMLQFTMPQPASASISASAIQRIEKQ
jgi:hypothetical protein